MALRRWPWAEGRRLNRNFLSDGESREGWKGKMTAERTARMEGWVRKSGTCGEDYRRAPAASEQRVRSVVGNVASVWRRTSSPGFQHHTKTFYLYSQRGKPRKCCKERQDGDAMSALGEWSRKAGKELGGNGGEWALSAGSWCWCFEWEGWWWYKDKGVIQQCGWVPGSNHMLCYDLGPNMQRASNIQRWCSLLHGS